MRKMDHMITHTISTKIANRIHEYNPFEFMTVRDYLTKHKIHTYLTAYRRTLLHVNK